MYAVVLSGGVGSRLWPISRKKHPKPFVKMGDGLSILQHTFSRVLRMGVAGMVNVTGNEFLFEVKKEYRDVLNGAEGSLESDYISEPFGRGTAAAIAISSLWVARKYGEDALLLVLPSDHFISYQAAFNEAVKKVCSLANSGKIVLFGIRPDSYETSYGYIKYNGNDVGGFIEKPSLDKAREYVISGNYLWNSGMFCFKASVMLQEMEHYCPDILYNVDRCFTASKVNGEGAQMSIDPDTFKDVREDSIDYAIMEKSQKIAVVPCDIGWSDIGTWNAISKLSACDASGNVIKAEAIIDRVTNCHIESSGNRLIGALDIDNLMIIDTPDALLVANKDNAQGVKDIYNRLAQSGHPTYELHKTVHRPWGTYTVLEEGVGYKIKHVEVEPKESLILQSHKYRSEHWVVVMGMANVINEDNSLTLSVGQSTYIPAGNNHRLANLLSEKLVIIEVQTGTYLGEDDITRFDDVYMRVDDI